MLVGIVVTTINCGEFLKSYYEEIKHNEALDHTLIFVIADKKTPGELFQSCQTYRQKRLKVVSPTLEEQEEFLKRVSYSELIPYNSDNRRNIGYLMAVEQGCDAVISIDDDNFAVKESGFLSEHLVVTRDADIHTQVDSDNGWFNPISMLETDSKLEIYPRGFPVHKRHEVPRITKKDVSAKVGINAGLWLQDPDVDAFTWLVAPTRVTGLKESPLVLGKGTWSPVNSQNTAVARNVMPSYYFPKMNYEIGGLHIDRYGDIFSGYFAVACCKAMGDTIRFGTPMVVHDRNAHNYLQDAAYEAAGIWILNDLLPWLSETQLASANYCDAYASLLEGLDEFSQRAKGRVWTDQTRAYFHDLTYCGRKWIAVMENIL